MAGKTQDVVFPIGKAWRLRPQKMEILTPEETDKRLAEMNAARERGLQALATARNQPKPAPPGHEEIVP